MSITSEITRPITGVMERLANRATAVTHGSRDAEYLLQRMRPSRRTPELLARPKSAPDIGFDLEKARAIHSNIQRVAALPRVTERFPLTERGAGNTRGIRAGIVKYEATTSQQLTTQPIMRLAQTYAVGESAPWTGGYAARELHRRVLAGGRRGGSVGSARPLLDRIRAGHGSPGALEAMRAARPMPMPESRQVAFKMRLENKSIAPVGTTGKSMTGWQSDLAFIGTGAALGAGSSYMTGGNVGQGAVMGGSAAGVMAGGNRLMASAVQHGMQHMGKGMMSDFSRNMVNVGAQMSTTNSRRAMIMGGGLLGGSVFGGTRNSSRGMNQTKGNRIGR